MNVNEIWKYIIHTIPLIIPTKKPSNTMSTAELKSFKIYMYLRPKTLAEHKKTERKTVKLKKKTFKKLKWDWQQRERGYDLQSPVEVSQSSRGPGGLCIDHSVSLTEAVNPAPHSLTNLFSSSSSKESPDPVRFGFFHCMNFRRRRFVKCQTFQATLSDSWLLYSVFDANVFLWWRKN